MIALTLGQKMVLTFALLLACIVVATFLLSLWRFWRPWVRARLAGARITVSDLVGMRRHRVNADVVLFQLIRAAEAGVPLSVAQLEAHYLAGGHVPETTTALLAARAAGLNARWDTLAAIDLRGEDVVAFVRAAIEAEWAPSSRTASVPPAAAGDHAAANPPPSN